MRRALALLALLLAPTGPLSAQAGAAPLRFEPWTPAAVAAASAPASGEALIPNAERSSEPASLALGGLVGAAAGIGVGFAAAELPCDYYPCEAIHGILGALVGTTLLVPAGVHLAGGRRGRYPTGVGGAALAAVAGLGLGAATGEDAFLLLIPVGQIAMAISMETRTAR